MYSLRSLGVALLVSVVSGCTQSKAAHCEGGEPSKAALLTIVKAEVKRRGGTTDWQHIRTDTSVSGCDYLVTVTFLPAKPGGFTVYIVSRAGKVVDSYPGE